MTCNQNIEFVYSHVHKIELWWRAQFDLSNNNYFSAVWPLGTTDFHWKEKSMNILQILAFVVQQKRLISNWGQE